MNNEKKFLDYEGIKALWAKINMQDYPNNETLIGIISAIDETKADKEEVQSKLDEIEEDISKKSQVQIVEANEIEDLSILKIYKLTQEEYEEALKNNTIDENGLYLTPDEGIDVDIDLSGYATIEQLLNKADLIHNHNDIYYTKNEIDDKLDNKSQVQIITWEADD